MHAERTLNARDGQGHAGAQTARASKATARDMHARERHARANRNQTHTHAHAHAHMHMRVLFSMPTIYTRCPVRGCNLAPAAPCVAEAGKTARVGATRGGAQQTLRRRAFQRCRCPAGALNSLNLCRAMIKLSFVVFESIVHMPFVVNTHLVACAFVASTRS